jgi:hypothetical protein
MSNTYIDVYGQITIHVIYEYMYLIIFIDNHIGYDYMYLLKVWII